MQLLLSIDSTSNPRFLKSWVMTNVTDIP